MNTVNQNLNRYRSCGSVCEKQEVMVDDQAMDAMDDQVSLTEVHLYRNRRDTKLE